MNSFGVFWLHGGDDGIPTVSLREPVRIASDAEPVGSYIQLSLGGDDGIRTHDPLLAGQVLSQLSYTPKLLGICFFSELS